MIKKIKLIPTLLLTLVSALYADVIFWDINGTLAEVDKGAVFIHHLGIARTCACLATYTWQYPFENPVKHMQQRYLEAINQVPCTRTTDYIIYSDDGITPLPPLLHNYMVGSINSEEAHTLWNAWLASNPQFFTNRFERYFICKTFEVNFDPVTFLRYNRPMQTVELLAQCAEQQDDQGNKKHVCIIVSNWAADQIELFKEHFKDSIMKYIKPTDCIFSGIIGCAKPHVSFYTYAYEFVKRTYPEQIGKHWFFFDDQEVNLDGAKAVMGESLICAHPRDAKQILCQYCTIA